MEEKNFELEIAPLTESGNYIWASYGGQTGWVDKRFIQYC